MNAERQHRLIADEIFENFLEGGMTDIDEKFLQYVDEEGLMWRVVEILALRFKGNEQKVQEKLDSLLTEIQDVVAEMVDEAAEDKM